MSDDSDTAVQEITVRLDSADGPGGTAVYRPGQMVTGRVRLRLLRPLTLRNLDLLVQGSGTIAWGQGGGHYVRDDEVYVNDMAELVVATGLGEVVTLSAGEHVFPFACSLPLYLPATFCGNFGSVAYAAKTVMQAAVPGAGGPWVAAAPFAVESLLPRGGHPPEQLRPCVVEARMAVGGGHGRCVKASLSVSRRLFATQEEIVISATVANRSRKTIARLTAALVMDCLYQAGGQQQHRESLLVADRVDEYRIGHMEGRCWKNVRLGIPRLVPPSGLPHCHLISVTYSLLFRVEVEDCAKDLNLRLPIVVGVAPAETGDGDSAAVPEEDAASAEPEVMRRMSRPPSVANFGDGDDNGNDSTSESGVWGRGVLQKPQQQPEGQRTPVGSTEKRLQSEYYMFDPAARQAGTSAAGDSRAGETVNGGGGGGGGGRFLPQDFYAPNTDGAEELY